MSDESRLLNIESRIKHLDKRLTDLENPTSVLAPVPSLVEAVTGLLKCSGCMVPSGSSNRDSAIILVEQALAREKKRQDDLSKLISCGAGLRLATQLFNPASVAYQTSVAAFLAALDAFDKDGGK